jgi:hypothetical protein
LLDTLASVAAKPCCTAATPVPLVASLLRLRHGARHNGGHVGDRRL